MNARRAPEYLRYLNWYLTSWKPIPLCSNLEAVLPLPDLTGVRILWPRRYCWGPGKRRLEPIRRELSGLVPVELYDQEADWHTRGGFPVPAVSLSSLGKPRNPKGPNDLRGEIFQVQFGRNVVRCAFDYSDYPIISDAVLDQVEVYFKKAVSPDAPLSPKVVSIGFYAKNPLLLGIARSRALERPANKKFDVYARFGSWTDSQPFRRMLIDRMRGSSLTFMGGFGIRTYPAYLTELMQAKLALDVPGQAAATPRLVEGMALGAVVVSARPSCLFPEKLMDDVHYVSFKQDGSDVVDICRELLANTERRKRITGEAMHFFDRNFSPQSMARRIIRHAAEVAGIAQHSGKRLSGLGALSQPSPAFMGR